jgi:hypothetical protein
MSRDFEVIKLTIDEAGLKTLSHRNRNQLIGCMHAHNELAILNRLLMFSQNDTAQGDLSDGAHSIQMWCILQLLVGKVFEAWNMLDERFLTAQPEDPALVSLSDNHRDSLKWLIEYFGVGKKMKPNALRTIRDKTAFHYDKLNLEASLGTIAQDEDVVYLAQRPANTLYYVGSALLFRTAFTMIAQSVRPTDVKEDRTSEGVTITIEDTRLANFHIHQVLHGLTDILLEKAVGKPLASLPQARIRVTGAPPPERVSLPPFIDVEPAAPRN